MLVIDPGPSAVDARHDEPTTSVREDLVTTAFGVWLVLGLFTDGWAHLNRPGLETFFTPWHGVLYSGFVASALWLGVLALRGRRRGRPWTRALPLGYRLAALGVLLFGIGGVSDMAWHLAFGVEVGIDALLSPTHLMLLIGGALVLTSALRAGWARPIRPGPGSARAELPAVLSLSLLTALGAFFLLYVSVFAGAAAAVELTRIPEGAPGHEVAELPAVAGLAGYLITTALLVAPVLLAQRVGRRPTGTIVLLVGVPSWLSASVAGFSPYGVTAATAVTLAALLVEVVAAWIDRSRLRRATRLPVIAATLPLLIWPAQILAVAVTDGVRWPVELWSGVVLLSTLMAASLGVMAGWSPEIRSATQLPPARTEGGPARQPARPTHA